MLCPLMTIARSVAADQVVSHGECQEGKCAWWDPGSECCCVRSYTCELASIWKAVLVASGYDPYEEHFR